jgi:hypothetical protein
LKHKKREPRWVPFFNFHIRLVGSSSADPEDCISNS